MLRIKSITPRIFHNKLFHNNKAFHGSMTRPFHSSIECSVVPSNKLMIGHRSLHNKPPMTGYILMRVVGFVGIVSATFCVLWIVILVTVFINYLMITTKESMLSEDIVTFCACLGVWTCICLALVIIASS